MMLKEEYIKRVLEVVLRCGMNGKGQDKMKKGKKWKKWKK